MSTSVAMKPAAKPATRKPAAKAAKAKTSAKAAKPAAKKPVVNKSAATKSQTFHVFNDRQKKFLPAPDARPLTLKGFEAFPFFLHRSLCGKEWTVSEAVSGASIITKPTQSEVKSRAIEILAKYGQNGLTERVAKAVKANGVAPGYKAPTRIPPNENKQTFRVITEDGTTVEVIYTPDFQHHLEFRGGISPTGYHSHFGYDGKVEVKDFARKFAETLRGDLLKRQAKLAEKNKAEPNTPQVTTRLKSKILAALVDEQKLPRPQTHFDEIVKFTGAAVADVSAALMMLELTGKVKSLPGRNYRMPTAEEQAAAKPASVPEGNRGGRPKGKMSMLDAAAEILKEAKEPLCCKDISRAIFEKKLAESAGRTPHATLSAAMGREITARGKNSRFKRADRGLFAYNS